MTSKSVTFNEAHKLSNTSSVFVQSHVISCLLGPVAASDCLKKWT